MGNSEWYDRWKPKPTPGADRQAVIALNSRGEMYKGLFDEAMKELQAAREENKRLRNILIQAKRGNMEPFALWDEKGGG